jgi:subtilisin family serine protease
MSRVSRSIVGVIAVVLAVLVAAPTASSRFIGDPGTEQPKPFIIEGMVTVQFAEGVDYSAYSNGFAQASFGIPSLDKLLADHQITEARKLYERPPRKAGVVLEGALAEMDRYFELHFDKSIPVQEVIEALSQNPNFKVVEPNWAFPVLASPTDPEFVNQWHHEQGSDKDIDSETAWEKETGKRYVVLAMIDSGVNYLHRDLAGNIWVNPGEDLDADMAVFDADDINGIDNDGNGKVDDLVGWDFFSGGFAVWPGEDGGTPDNDPNDFNGHGTHCAGVAAAVTNNSVDVAGVAGGWGSERHLRGARIMCLRAGATGSDGNGYMNANDCGQAIVYAVENGADVISCSWGSQYNSFMNQGMQLAAAHGVTVVHAAGNEDNENSDWLDSDPYTTVLSVAATNQFDIKASFSNYGFWIDLSAPGVSILSTVSDEYVPGLASYQGTSMSCPMVAGGALLVRSALPTLTKAQVDSILLATTDDIYSLNPSYLGKLGTGRLNVGNALADLPYADFSADVTVGNVPLEVNFTDLSPASPNPPSAWNWDFGDGGNSAAQNPGHTYTVPGMYEVSLSADVGHGLGDGLEIKPHYIWAHADTIRIEPMDIDAGETAVIPVYLRNTQLVKSIQFAFKLTGIMGAQPTPPYASVSGLRTDYFHDVSLTAYDAFFGRFAVLLESSASGESQYLPIDTGIVMYLHISIPSGAEGDLTIDTVTASGKNPKLSTIWGDYFPYFEPAVLSVGGCGHGDVNCDGVINVTDLTALVAFLFSSGAPVDPKGGDVNGDGVIGVPDVTYLVAYLFNSGPPPPSK